MEPRNVEIMAELKPVIARLVEQHIASQRLWMPSDLLPQPNSVEQQELQDNARTVPDIVRAVLVLNTLTEDGLPSFHRLLAVHLGDDNYWKTWIDLWTAEENRHVVVLDQYIHTTWLVNVPEFEQLRYEYLLSGFRPNWSFDPLFMIIAYTVIQEAATQISHRNIGAKVKQVEPTLCKILGHVAGEEGRHAHVYRSVFEVMLHLEPDRALQALWRTIRSFTMPGVSIPIYKYLAELAMRTGVFTPAGFGSIVNDLIKRWNIFDIHSLSLEGTEAKERILAFPNKQAKIQARLERQPEAMFQFTFLSQPIRA